VITAPVALKSVTTPCHCVLATGLRSKNGFESISLTNGQPELSLSDAENVTAVALDDSDVDNVKFDDTGGGGRSLGPLALVAAFALEFELVLLVLELDAGTKFDVRVSNATTGLAQYTSGFDVVAFCTVLLSVVGCVDDIGVRDGSELLVSQYARRLAGASKSSAMISSQWSSSHTTLVYRQQQHDKTGG
jgi:hypothetical protein